jgi:hypothetical protein
MIFHCVYVLFVCFVYLFLICLKGYVHAYRSLRHKIVAYMFQPNKVHGHSQFINRELHICRVVSAERLQEIRWKYAGPSGHEV